MTVSQKWIVGGAVGVTAIVGFAIFRPDTLFINKRVDDVLPASAVSSNTPVPTATTSASSVVTPAATPVPVPGITKVGSFVSKAHETSGSVRYFVDGSDKYLRIENLKTDNGPDLLVYLTKNSDGAVADGQYIDLGALKGNLGNQNYLIPASVNLGEYGAVVIWCRRFSVAFGVASVR
jgi:hypothetical protein